MRGWRFKYDKIFKVLLSIFVKNVISLDHMLVMSTLAFKMSFAFIKVIVKNTIDYFFSKDRGCESSKKDFTFSNRPVHALKSANWYS